MIGCMIEKIFGGPCNTPHGDGCSQIVNEALFYISKPNVHKIGLMISKHLAEQNRDKLLFYMLKCKQA